MDDFKYVTLGFAITYHGDISVGIFSQEWFLKGHYQFDTIEQYNEFANGLRSCHELVSDGPIDVQPVAPCIRLRQELGLLTS